MKKFFLWDFGAQTYQGNFSYNFCDGATSVIPVGPAYLLKF